MQPALLGFQKGIVIKNAREFFHATGIGADPVQQGFIIGHVPVAEFLRRCKWNNKALAAIYAYEPTSIRVVHSTPDYLDFQHGRITVQVDALERIVECIRDTRVLVPFITGAQNEKQRIEELFDRGRLYRRPQTADGSDARFDAGFDLTTFDPGGWEKVMRRCSLTYKGRDPSRNNSFLWECDLPESRLSVNTTNNPNTGENYILPHERSVDYARHIGVTGGQKAVADFCAAVWEHASNIKDHCIGKRCYI